MNYLRKENKKKLLKDSHQLREQMKNDVESTTLIREDRNAR